MFSSVLIPARVSWINPLPCRSDSVRTSFGLLLVYLDYLSALPCWILFADRRPTLALGLLSALSVSYLFADVFDPACFVTMSINKSLQMDPHASRRLRNRILGHTRIQRLFMWILARYGHCTTVINPRAGLAIARGLYKSI